MHAGIDREIDREIEKLQRMTIGELRRKHEEIFGEPSRSGNREFLWRRIAWRIQELAFGGLSERARRRAEELANDADLRIRPPRGYFDRKGVGGDAGPVRVVSLRTGTSAGTRDRRLPAPGTILSRVYKDRRIDVQVREDGFEHDGKVYRSLTAIANEVTGSHWNGMEFFGCRAASSNGKPSAARKAIGS